MKGFIILGHLMITGWGSTTDWSKWQNVEDENILCKDSDQSYIVQAITRWNNDADDNRQFRWVCSPPDNSKKDILSASKRQNLSFTCHDWDSLF